MQSRCLRPRSGTLSSVQRRRAARKNFALAARDSGIGKSHDDCSGGRSRHSTPVSFREDGSLLFEDVSFTQPASWFHYVAGKPEPVKTALVGSSPVSFDDIEVTREFATAKDGAKLTLNIVRTKGSKLA